MSRAQPIPPQQRSNPAEFVRDRLRSAEPGRRDETAGLPSGRPGGGVTPREKRP